MACEDPSKDSGPDVGERMKFSSRHMHQDSALGSESMVVRFLLFIYLVSLKIVFEEIFQCSKV